MTEKHEPRWPKKGARVFRKLGETEDGATIWDDPVPLSEFEKDDDEDDE